MTKIDELIRETLAADARTHQPTADLAARSITGGRRLRRRRQAALGMAVLGSGAAIVAGSLAVVANTGQDEASPVVTSAGHGGGSTHRHGGPHRDAARPWTSWPAHRLFGPDPGTGFFQPSHGDTVFAAGTMRDGTDFVVYGNRKDGNSAQFLQGWNGAGNFGESAGEAPGGANAAYLTAETPTYKAGRRGMGTGQWLIVVGRPGTSSASYSADGVNWQPMQVRKGVAVIRLGGIAPRSSMIRLSDHAGEYVNGPLALP